MSRTNREARCSDAPADIRAGFPGGGFMSRVIRSLSFIAVSLLFVDAASGQEVPQTQQVPNWPAPLSWTPPAARVLEGARTEAASTAATPLPFIAITPCRVADTRGNGFTGAYGIRTQ